MRPGGHDLYFSPSAGPGAARYNLTPVCAKKASSGSCAGGRRAAAIDWNCHVLQIQTNYQSGWSLPEPHVRATIGSCFMCSFLCAREHLVTAWSALVEKELALAHQLEVAAVRKKIAAEVTRLI